MKPHPLKIERKLRGWSQAKVAEAVGTNVRTVIRWEQRRTLPYPYYRERLCTLFGKNTRELGLLEDAEEYVDAFIYEPTPDQQSIIPVTALPRSSPDHPSLPGQFWRVPSPLLSLVGRAQEIEEIKELMMAVRLLTLIGTGGIGKTRLSIQLAYELRPLFPGGVCFISLTAAREPEQVMPLIARGLELEDKSGSPYERVREFLREKAWLLVLDNFEQVVQAAPELERLLVDCPLLKVLVTSRAVLHLPSEYQYRLLPLAVPNLKQCLDSITVKQSPSIQLFLQRARMLLPTFEVTESNAVALANICARLDGLPLAIELAAARIKLFPPHALLPRLSRSLQVLTKGLPALPERQQALRSTLQWSYDLLDARTQRLFRLLSLFVGGFTVEAAEALFTAVMREDNSSMSGALDGLDALIDHSLLQPAVSMDEYGESRLQMLETIREFGRERLLESEDMELARKTHASYYLQLAEGAAQDMPGSRQVKWLDRLDQEHGNLQAAMEWMLSPGSLSSAEGEDAGRRAMALRLGGALGWFWMARGYLSEGWRFVEQALRAYGEGDAEETLPLARAYLLAASLSARLGNLEHAEVLGERGITCAGTLRDRTQLAEAFRVAGWVAHQRGQGERAFALYERGLALVKELDDRKGIAATMLNMAFVLQTRGDYEQTCILLEEVVARQRALHNKTGLYCALYQLAQSLFCAEEHPPLGRIHSLLREGLALAEEVGDRRGVAGFQGLLGWVISGEGRLAEACGLVEECLHFYRGGDRDIYGQYLAILGEILAAKHDYAAAQSVFEESLAVDRELGAKTEIAAIALEGMAGLAQAQGHHSWAVRLWAKAGQRREEAGVPWSPRERHAHECSLEQLRISLGEKAFADLCEEGRALTLDEAWSARHRPTPCRLR